MKAATAGVGWERALHSLGLQPVLQSPPNTQTGHILKHCCEGADRQRENQAENLCLELLMRQNPDEGLAYQSTCGEGASFNKQELFVTSPALVQEGSVPVTVMRGP